MNSRAESNALVGHQATTWRRLRWFGASSEQNMFGRGPVRCFFCCFQRIWSNKGSRSRDYKGEATHSYLETRSLRFLGNISQHWIGWPRGWLASLACKLHASQSCLSLGTPLMRWHRLHGRDSDSVTNTSFSMMLQSNVFFDKCGIHISDTRSRWTSFKQFRKKHRPQFKK